MGRHARKAPRGIALTALAVPVRCMRLRLHLPVFMVLAQRKPMLLLRFVGVLLLRYAERRLLALLFQLPPRITRLEYPKHRLRAGALPTQSS
jgi:hypothetical protein